MRQKLVDGLNDLLGIDHDLVRDIFTNEFDLAADSFLQKDKNAYDKGGIKVMTALSLLGVIVDGEPIEAVFEGDLIKEFK